MTTLPDKIVQLIKNNIIYKIEQARIKHSEDKEFQKFLDHAEKLITTPTHKGHPPDHLKEERRQEIKEAQENAKQKTRRD